MSFKFEWDDGNIEKNFIKHGVTIYEVESIWIDESRKIVVSRFTEKNELRFACVGKSNSNRLLSVIFTFRKGNHIRPISARPSNKREKELYNG